MLLRQQFFSKHIQKYCLICNQQIALIFAAYIGIITQKLNAFIFSAVLSLLNSWAYSYKFNFEFNPLVLGDLLVDNRH